MNSPVWVGFQNYRDMFADKDFYHSMGVTLKYLVLSVPIYLVTAMALALLLNHKLRGMYIFRTIMFMPSVIAGTAVAVMWSMLLNPDLGSDLTSFCAALGLPTLRALAGQQRLGRPGGDLDGAVGHWRRNNHLPGWLAKHSTAPIRGFDIDGANGVQKLFNITLPLLTPTIFFQLITGLVGAFQVFDVAYVLSGRGARRGALLFYLLNLYDEGFRNSRYGYASALAWILVILATISILITFRASERFVYYEGDAGKR